MLSLCQKEIALCRCLLPYKDVFPDRRFRAELQLTKMNARHGEDLLLTLAALNIVVGGLSSHSAKLQSDAVERLQQRNVVNEYAQIIKTIQAARAQRKMLGALSTVCRSTATMIQAAQSHTSKRRCDNGPWWGENPPTHRHSKKRRRFMRTYSSARTRSQPSE